MHPLLLAILAATLIAAIVCIYRWFRTRHLAILIFDKEGLSRRGLTVDGFLRVAERVWKDIKGKV